MTYPVLQTPEGHPDIEILSCAVSIWNETCNFSSVFGLPDVFYFIFFLLPQIKNVEKIIKDVDRVSGEKQCQFYVRKLYHVSEEQVSRLSIMVFLLRICKD